MAKINPFVYMNPSDQKINPYIFEEWKPIEIDGIKSEYYFVSNFGRVKTKNDVIVKPNEINSGYNVVRLTNGLPYSTGERKYKHLLVHRLVMKVFNDVENFDKLTVNHINHDKKINNIFNLNYMTQAENNEDKIRHYHKYGKEQIYNATFSDEQLIVIYRELKKGTSYKEILSLIGVPDSENNRDYIGNIKRGKTYQRQINELKLRKLID